MNRQQMINEIAKYKMDNGYYDTIQMRIDIAGMSEKDAKYDAFWGSTDVGVKTVDKYPLIALAEELDEKRERGEIEEEQAEAAERVEAAIQRYNDGTATNYDLDLIVKANRGRKVYGDPQSNRPTHIELIPQRSNADADTEH